MYAVSYIAHNWLIKRALNRAFAQALPCIQGITLDLGCGEKPFGQDISCQSTYFGIDWLNTKHRLSADVVADLNQPLPFASGCADCLVSFEVLEHLAEPDLMLAEAFRLLRPDGRIILSMPFQWWEHEAPWDYQRFTRYGLTYRLSKAGFTDIAVEATTGFWSTWILKFNYQLERLVRGPRIARAIIRAALVPVWLTDQILALLLDRVWSESRETAGYLAVARKPCI